MHNVVTPENYVVISSYLPQTGTGTFTYPTSILTNTSDGKEEVEMLSLVPVLGFSNDTSNRIASRSAVAKDISSIENFPTDIQDWSDVSGFFATCPISFWVNTTSSLDLFSASSLMNRCPRLVARRKVLA